MSTGDNNVYSVHIHAYGGRVLPKQTIYSTSEPCGVVAASHSINYNIADIAVPNILWQYFVYRIFMEV